MADGVENNLQLKQDIIANPDDDAPRFAYAAWFRGQSAPMAQHIANFIEAQIRVAHAFRADPRADVHTLRSWSDRAHVTVPEFRAGVHVRRWLLQDLRMLIDDGLVGWPQFYRGGVERVAMRARRFLELGDEVFRVAPVRHLILTQASRVIGDLARSPDLARIRSLSFPADGPRDVLSDQQVATLVASQHLAGLAHLRFVQQTEITPRSYELIATARTLPNLSCLEVFRATTWSDKRQELYAPIGRRDRLFTRDTTKSVRRDEEWIPLVEAKLGHMPCFHPGLYYHPAYVDLESVVEHPIAFDEQVMRSRGQRVAEPSRYSVR